jgi:peptidyl-prolyl cis-trans isomerase D
MLAFFRSLAKNKFVLVLLGLPLVAGVLLIGNVRADLGGLLTPNAVISAGSRSYSVSEYKTEFENYRKQQAQQGQTMTADEMVAQGLDQRMLEAFAEREATYEELRRDRVIPSDALVVDEIRKNPSFFDSISGKFDEKTYEALLAQNGLTPEIFQTSLRDEAAGNQFASGLAAGFKPPRLMAAAIADFEFEAHNLSVFSIDPKLLGAPPTPTDAQLKALMDANAQALTTPETRVFTVVRFSAQALGPTLVADPAEVKKRYDFRKDTLSTPEMRSLVQIPAKTAADAAVIAAKLTKGEDPAAVAKAAGVEPLNYADKPKGGIADPKVADAAFALAEGKVSGPIQGQLGYAVVKVLKITPAHEVSFDEARPKIEDEVKAEAAADKAYAMSQKYDEARQKGASVTDAAKAAGVAAVSMGPVAASGADETGKPVGLSPKMLKEGFALSQGADTDVTQEAKGEYFVVQADKVIPPAAPTLDKVRGRLTQYFQQTEMNKRLNARLDELAAQVKMGKPMEAVAASVGSKVSPVTFTRAQAQQDQKLAPEQLDKLFQAKTGDVITSGAAVVKVVSITPPSASMAVAIIGSAQQQLGRQMFDEVGQEARAYAKTTLKAKINLALARQAIGVSPAATTPPAPAKPGAPPAAGRAK